MPLPPPRLRIRPRFGIGFGIGGDRSPPDAGAAPSRKGALNA